MNILVPQFFTTAVGGVQGFAFTLGLATILDLSMSCSYHRPWFLVRTKFFGEGHKLSGLDPEHLGAKSAAVYAGRGRVRGPERNVKKHKKEDELEAGVPDLGRQSIAERRRAKELEEQAAEQATATKVAEVDEEARAIDDSEADASKEEESN